VSGNFRVVSQQIGQGAKCIGIQGSSGIYGSSWIVGEDGRTLEAEIEEAESRYRYVDRLKAKTAWTLSVICQTIKPTRNLMNILKSGESASSVY
jgi:hypothetical protein